MTLSGFWFLRHWAGREPAPRAWVPRVLWKSLGVLLLHPKGLRLGSQVRFAIFYFHSGFCHLLAGMCGSVLRRRRRRACPRRMLRSVFRIPEPGYPFPHLSWPSGSARYGADASGHRDVAYDVEFHLVGRLEEVEIGAQHVLEKVYALVCEGEGFVADGMVDRAHR